METTAVPPVCVVCRLPIEPKPDALGIVAWPVDNQGPKHWGCWRSDLAGDEMDELRLFRMLHRWHEGIDDRYLDEKLRVEELCHGLIEMRDRLRQLRNPEKG
jgi:hypothetical protein